jgi:hypothetical protein
VMMRLSAWEEIVAPAMQAFYEATDDR